MSTVHPWGRSGFLTETSVHFPGYSLSRVLSSNIKQSYQSVKTVKKSLSFFCVVSS